MGKEKISLLDTIPCICEHIVTEKEGELSVIAFPRFKNKFMQKHFVPKTMSPFIHIRLEEHGTAVWNLIDGKRTVREITEALAVHFNQEENYESRVTIFISQLQAKGLIKLRIMNYDELPYRIDS